MDDFKDKRLELGLTQSQLAVMVGVSLTTIQLWERGTSKPTEENQKKLDGIFKVGREA